MLFSKLFKFNSGFMCRKFQDYIYMDYLHVVYIMFIRIFFYVNNISSVNDYKMNNTI